MAPSSGKTFLRYRSVIVLTVSLVFFCTLHPEVASLNRPMIATKTLLGLSSSSNCTDNTGAVVGNGHEWPTTASSCDVNRCWHSPIFKFVIRYSCPAYTYNDNPDPDNCNLIGNSSQAFPSCCPVFVCGLSAPLTTISPTVCRDLSSQFACSVWYNMTQGCQSDVDGHNNTIYNYATKYCNQTCMLC